MFLPRPVNELLSLTGLGLLLASLWILQGDSLAAEPILKTPAFLRDNCADCHDGPSGEGGFDVSSLGMDLTDPATMKRWVRIFDRVQDDEMPPKDAGEVDATETAKFLDLASVWLRQSQQQQFDRHGRVQSRRLTNLQLERTLHDLFAIDVPLTRMMPVEPRTDGFTGLADHQSLSHFQLESQLQAVDIALDAALDRVTQPDQPFRRQYDATDLARVRPKQRCRDPEMIDGKAVVWSSGLVFYGRITSTTISQDGWYRITFSASAMNKPAEHGVWCTVRSGYCSSGAPQLAWIGSFEANDESVQHSFDAWIPRGNMIEIRPGDETLEQAKFRGGQVGAGEGGPQNVPGVALHSMVIQRIHPSGEIELARRHLLGDLNVTVDTQQKKIHLVSDDPIRDLSKQLRRFATRAFRRPVSNEEVKPFQAWMRKSLDDGDDPIDALLSAYRAILISPRFMYFVEPDAGELDDYAIATRLSYMLRGSMPDWPLIKLAGEGKLRDADVLREQVDRLLQGEGTRKFAEDLADQWLDMADIDFTEPDRKLYRDFDNIVQHAMLEETTEYLAHLIRTNASVGALIDSDFTFLNSRLARYYDIEGVQGDQVHKVDLPADSARGGLLSQGAILKVTANGTNTSPVLRGVWVSERILGIPIPPPPESVPAVEPDIRGAKTIREQLVKHLSDESCNACHRHIDPPGYALENFDAAGRWRDKYQQVNRGTKGRHLPVDSSFQLSDGRKFENFDEFRQLVCSDLRPVARNFAAQLMVYGTGRQIEFADRDDLQQIVDSAESDHFGIRSLLHAVVTSPPFLNK